MAEGEQLPFLSNCKLTINSKVTSGSGKLYKLLTNQLKFKIVGCDPLVIEKDDPSLDDIEQVFNGIRSLCATTVSTEQTVKHNVQGNRHHVTNILSQTEHIGEYHQLVSSSNNAHSKDATHEQSCKESKSSETTVSENFNLLYKEDIISDMNISLPGKDKEKKIHTAHNKDTQRDEKLIKITEEENQRESEPFDESLLSFATPGAVVKETDKKVVEESAAEYLTQMSDLKELDLAKRSNISGLSNEDVEFSQGELMQDSHSSLYDSTSRDRENIENVPAWNSLDGHDRKDTNSLSVDNKILDVLLTASASDVLQTESSSSEIHPLVLGRGDSESKIIKDNENSETSGKLNQTENVMSNKSSLCSKLNFNGITDEQNVEKVVEEQSQDIHHFENTAGCSTKLKSAGQQMQHEEFETLYIPEMSAETIMSGDRYTSSKEISRAKGENINTFSSPTVSGTYGANKIGYCVVSDVSKLNIQIYKASITELQVDCIVNAANKNLMHIGGVAKAISDAAGSALRKECNDYTKDGGVLDVTGIFVTTGGNLFAKYVIHAVGPQWDSYDEENKRQCFTDLRHTVIRCLVEANRCGLTSIAFPSISAAIFRVPKEQCARCYLEAVKHFDILSVGDRLTLQEIHFVDVDATMVDIIVECFSSNWSILSDIDIVLKDAEFVDQHLKSVSKNEKKDDSRLSDEEIKSTKVKSTLSSVLTEDMAAAAALTASQPLVDHLSYNKDSSGKLNNDQSNVNHTDPALTTSQPLVGHLTYNPDCSSKLNRDKSNVNQSAAALNDDETYEISATYQLGKITLQLESGHAFEIKSDVIFTVGKPFDKLSSSPDFSIATSLKLCEPVKSQENKYTYFNASQLNGSQSRYLCEVFPEPEQVETITEAFENLEIAVKICKQLPNTLIITGSVLYSDPSNMQLQNGNRNNLHMKNVARFAFSLYNFLDRLSRETQQISVLVVGSEDSLSTIIRVIESHNVVKVYPTGAAATVQKVAAAAVIKGAIAAVQRGVTTTVNTSDAATVQRGVTATTGDSAIVLKVAAATGNIDDSDSDTDDSATVLKVAATTGSIGDSDSDDSTTVLKIPTTTGNMGDSNKSDFANVLKGAATTGNMDDSDSDTDDSATVLKGITATLNTSDAAAELKVAAASRNTDADANVQKGACANVNAGNVCGFCFQNSFCERLACCEKWLCQDCEQHASVCPFCQNVRKIITGNQPPGSMTVDLIEDYADGYENDRAWEIEYYFPAGTQKECHPHPGKTYDSVTRTAYLPANSQGYQVLLRLRLAFIRNLIFTIGHSNSRNKDDVIVWDGITHKTNLHRKKHGYPDPDYLTQVTLELSNKGVQITTSTAAEKKQLSEFVRCIKENESFSDL